MTLQEYQAINLRFQQEAQRQQELWRAERLQRDLIEEQRRHNNILERQNESGSWGGLFLLILVGSLIVGALVVVLWGIGRLVGWLVRVGWRWAAGRE
jgi:hypothetical protein